MVGRLYNEEDLPLTQKDAQDKYDNDHDMNLVFEPICELHGDGWGDITDNAALIASAPAMLAVLEQIQFLLDDWSKLDGSKIRSSAVDTLHEIRHLLDSFKVE